MRSPLRTLTLPDVSRTRPLAARRRHASAIMLRSFTARDGTFARPPMSEHPLTRRRLIGTALATGAAAALPEAADARKRKRKKKHVKKRRTRKADYVVV